MKKIFKRSLFTLLAVMLALSTLTTAFADTPGVSFSNEVTGYAYKILDDKDKVTSDFADFFKAAKTNYQNALSYYAADPSIKNVTLYMFVNDKDDSTPKPAVTGSKAENKCLDIVSNKSDLENSVENYEYIEFQDLESARLDANYFEASILSKVSDQADKNCMIQWLLDYVDLKGSAISSSKTAIDGTSVSLEPGYYIFDVVDKTTSLRNKLLTQVTTDTRTIQLKTTDIVTEKEVAKLAGATVSDLEYGVGDFIPYTVKTTLPDMSKYDFSAIGYASPLNMSKSGDAKSVDIDRITANKPYCYIYDKLSHQCVDVNDVTLTIDGKEYKIKVTDGYSNNGFAGYFYYTSGVTSTAFASMWVNQYDETNNVQEFYIIFNANKMNEYNLSNENIQLDYKAELISTAVSVNGNHAELVYSNLDGNKIVSAATDTKVYTYGVYLTKSFSDNSNKYSDVKFTLYTSDEYTKTSDKKASIVSTFDGKDNGVYKLSDSKESTLTEMSLTNDGTLTLLGLDTDVDYYLVETSPSGYNAVTLKFQISTDTEHAIKLSDSTAVDANNASSGLVTVGTAVKNYSDIPCMTISVMNQKHNTFNLPSTGAHDTWVMTIIGILVVTSGVLIFITPKRKNNA